MNDGVHDSKKLWLSIQTNLEQFDLGFGRGTAQAYVYDTRMIAFVASRYKFASKMLAGVDTALEIGCGDGFGAPFVAQTVKRLICTDIDETTIKSNRTRLAPFKNIEFHYYDFRESTFREKVRAIYLVDVIEHIFPEEEPGFLKNLVQSLTPDGFVLMGTPNVTANQYASVHSQEGHVNLKSHTSLKELGLKYFQNAFMFSMNDEVVHTGFAPMSNYLWLLAVGPRPNAA
jgi:2-polyprenyl-3-methyl-5-hydroxy-6-metoxy-1,4-benzoquinol methylase